MGFLIERRLVQVGRRLRALREELRVIDEQRSQFSEEAQDWAIRALVSENPADGLEANQAGKHAAAMISRRRDVVAEIAVLETKQDELLDQMSS